ncbi:MAG: hypothetical protein B6U76_00185 [Desulfurococcales archaeon ex4484_217_2]|nr:MAG: hypothetical protein B6U76_00185 [Desulfurococcales archaeon ex4484_217_2]
MSEQAKMEIKLGAMSIVLSITISLIGTIWYAGSKFGEIDSRLDQYQESITDLNKKVMEITKILIEDKR